MQLVYCVYFEYAVFLSDKTKYMVMSREQTVGLSHTMKVDNSSIERVVGNKYMVMSREQTAGLSHTMKVANSSIERVVGNNFNKSKFYSRRN